MELRRNLSDCDRRNVAVRRVQKATGGCVKREDRSLIIEDSIPLLCRDRVIGECCPSSDKSIPTSLEEISWKCL